MDVTQSDGVVRAFLSCSIRPNDWTLVGAMERYLHRRGFRCYTIGRNLSYPEQTDEAIRKAVDACDCFIGAATQRFDAIDRDFPSTTLKIATPYLLQETSMAFQSGLPFLVFKTPAVTLQGITNRNLWIEIDDQLHNGILRIKRKEELVESALNDLKKKALNRRTKLARDKTLSDLGRVSLVGVGGYGAYRILDWLGRPECFGSSIIKIACAKAAITKRSAR